MDFYFLDQFYDLALILKGLSGLENACLYTL